MGRLFLRSRTSSTYTCVIVITMVTGNDREEERKGVVIKSGWCVCTKRGKKEFAERTDGWKRDPERTVEGRRREELRRRRKKAFSSIYFYFCAFLQLQHAFQFGDAAPVPPPNRSDNSFGSTANR